MPELITVTEAAERAGLSLMTFRKRMREYGLTIYINPRDRREKLVDASDVDAMLEPHPEREGKAAA
jgi:hypothetical protein